MVKGLLLVRDTVGEEILEVMGLQGWNCEFVKPWRTTVLNCCIPDDNWRRI